MKKVRNNFSHAGIPGSWIKNYVLKSVIGNSFANNEQTKDFARGIVFAKFLKRIINSFRPTQIAECWIKNFYFVIFSQVLFKNTVEYSIAQSKLKTYYLSKLIVPDSTGYVRLARILRTQLTSGL